MPWSGGSFSLSQDFIADAAAGPPASFITAAKVDNVLEDLADGLEATINRNGDNAAAAHISWGNFKITNLGAATVGTDAVRARQVAENTLQYGGTTGGSSNAYTLTSTFITAVASGTRLLLKANHSNSGAATLALNGGVATAIRDIANAALAASAITSGRFFEIVYDETTGHWHLGTGLTSNDIGVSVQGYDAQLAALAALVTAANKGLYFTASDTPATFDQTAYGRTIQNLADAPALRSNLSLGALALLSTVNNGEWSGIDLAVVNGGTGASTAGDARTNLSAAAKSQTWRESIIIEFPENGDYHFYNFFLAGDTVTSVFAASASGSCTLTVKVGGTPLGGTPNAVSTSGQTQGHSSSNVAGDGVALTLTVSSNSSCVRMSVALLMTRPLA